jgi:cellulose synthase/poly-beta-1,6-N-acetylglucosamine synthase-like glycosyltransferase
VGLAESRPELSARNVITSNQARIFVSLAVIAAGAFLAAPVEAFHVVVGAMAIGFVFSLILRCVLALVGKPPAAALQSDDNLPTYSILIPVYREAGMIPQMARSIASLDYPAEKLDVSLVVEEDDAETREAVRAAGLRAIVVPPCVPRTKPKACNFALQMARGEFIVVYDAEDRPEPDQLRKAVAAFRSHPEISCFQARLAIDRATGWLAHMFAVDYDLWFRMLLPGLARLGGPIPLGGTSNHFRTASLVDAGAWDPFNVTEDADLGVRLARLGQGVAILDSTTFEEAPTRFSIWLRQRTRWMKGYMQTVLVHSRDLAHLNREIGVGGLVLFGAFLGGAIWSSLVNPVMWLTCIAGLLQATVGTSDLGLLARISGGTLLFANLLLAGLAILRSGRRPAVTALVLTYPAYWFLISAAGYRAAWQLLRDPFRWEKTPHGSAGG